MCETTQSKLATRVLSGGPWYQAYYQGRAQSDRRIPLRPVRQRRSPRRRQYSSRAEQQRPSIPRTPITMSFLASTMLSDTELTLPSALPPTPLFRVSWHPFPTTTPPCRATSPSPALSCT
eukprot:2662475-Rhodomonas_salina.3